METPVPAPRSLSTPGGGGEGKKPVPAPRKSVKKSISATNVTTTQNGDESFPTNTFSRRVRCLSYASKQIAEDIGELVQDKKKAVIAGTRQSVRKITKRFNSLNHDDNDVNKRKSTDDDDDGDDDNNNSKNNDENTIDMFSSISFQSPIVRSQSIYNNIDTDNETNNNNNDDDDDDDEYQQCYSNSFDDFISSPPPNHPPPPLPLFDDDGIYDAPSSITSGSSTSNSERNPPVVIMKQENYESIFPIYSNNNNNSNSDTDSNRNFDLTRSSSWKFYDIVTKTDDHVYNDIDGTGANNSSNSNNSITTTTTTTNSSNIDNKIDDNNSVLSSVNIRNSLYENHCIIGENLNSEKNRNRPSQSVILQFDPLKNTSTSQENLTNPSPSSQDLRMLEEFLQGDLYGNLSISNTIDNWSISNDSELDDLPTLPPPPPPVRYDSLPEEEQQPPPSPPQEQKQEQTKPQSSTPKDSNPSRTSWFYLNELRKSNTSQLLRKSSWLKPFKGVLEKAPDVVRNATSISSNNFSNNNNNKNKDAIVQRPELQIKNFVYKKGMLYKVQGGPVEDLFGEYSGRWCVLENSNLICYADNSEDSIREHFPADTIISIQILQDPKFKYKYDNEDLHCFELNTTGKSRGGHIYGTRDISERRIWMQCIAECLTKRFSTKVTSDYTRMGWAYLREGVSGKWTGSWIILSHRNLYYTIDNNLVKLMDLRKVRCIVLQIYQDSDNNPKTNDKGPNMVVDTTNVTLYLRMWTSRETKVWCHIVKLAAHNNGANLDQQQLTKNDIPVIVEKCINFIYAHGSMTEGIYRKSGSNSVISEILTKFRKDGWAVQLTDKYTEHDVAAALKRFFRDLPEPLLSNKQRQYFYQVSLVKDKNERIRMYKAALEQLPLVSLKTAKKLLGHLHFIASQSSKNRMPLENLAAIWGPTLMHYEDKGGVSSNRSHQQDVAVVGQLIEMYKDIFPEDSTEIEQEKLMLQVLERYSKSPHYPAKSAGDLRVWIYYKNKDGSTFNVAVGPNKSAFDICAELSVKVKVPVHELILEEVVLNDQLTRPIHHTEKVLNIVLQWGYWDDSDRKDNHLILTHMTKYLDFVLDKQVPVVSNELKFADNKTRSFKYYMLEFSQAKLTCYKDKSSDVKLHVWNIEDIVWYLGHEHKRNPQSRWTITFIETKTPPKRTKTTIYFGNVLVFNDAVIRANWLAAMLKARYQESLHTPPMHVNLLGS